MKRLKAAVLSISIPVLLAASMTALAADKGMDQGMCVDKVFEFTGGEAGKAVENLSIGSVNREIQNFQEYLQQAGVFSIAVKPSMDGTHESSLYWSRAPYEDEEGNQEHIAVLAADQEHPWQKDSCMVIKIGDVTSTAAGIELEMGASADGPRDFQISYSLDQGETWKDYDTMGTDLGSAMAGQASTLFRKNTRDIERTFETVKKNEVIHNDKTGADFDYQWDMKLYDDLYFKVSVASDYKADGSKGLYGSSAGEWGLRSVKILQHTVQADAPAPPTQEDDKVYVPECPLPSFVKAYKTARKEVTLTWKKASPDCSYEIYLKKGNGNYKKIKTVTSPQDTKHVIKNLSPTAIYQVRMSSYDIVEGRKRYSGGFTEPITVNMKKQPILKNLSVQKSVSLKVGALKTLTVKCTQGASRSFIKQVIYKVKNPKIASVKPSGVIEGRKKGTTKITIKVKLKSGLSKSFVTNVKVVD